MAYIGDIKNTNNIQQNPTFGVKKKNKKITPEKVAQNKADAKELEEKYLDKKEGFVATACDKIKCMTALGKNSDIARLKIEQLKKGKISKKGAENYLKQNQYNHKDETEIVTDLMSGAAALGVYTALKKAQIVEKTTLGNNNQKMTTALLVGASILTGAVVKPILKAINKIGMDKETRKKEKSLGKDIITGAINGVLAPVSVVKGILIGVPTVLVANSAVRYATIEKDDKNLRDFLYQQKEDLGLKALAAGTVLVGSHFSHKNISNWQEDAADALKKASKLKTASEKNLASFMELEETLGLMNNDEVVNILKSDLSPQAKMAKLEEKNIFYAKYLQTIPEKGPGSFDEQLKPENIDKMVKRQLPADVSPEIASSYRKRLVANISAQKAIVEKCKAECPPSRTMSEAIEEIEKAFGRKYLLLGDKALGCGSVAESYLAKNLETDKKVVIKINKKTASLEKFNKDKEKALQILKKRNLSEKEYNRYKGLIDGLYGAWDEEVDLSKEFNSASKLASSVKKCKSVKPIEVKNNIFVMEVAEGGSLQGIEKYMKENNIVLSDEEKLKFIKKYQKLVAEQLVDIPLDGNKVIHADPHSGNIMADPTNLDSPFTFIDSGNVIERKTLKDAVDDTLNFVDILTGNTDGIARYVLKGAKTQDEVLSGKEMEKAQKYLSSQLKKKLFSGSKKPDSVEEVMSLCNKIAKNKDITLAPEQANYIKAQATHSSNISKIAQEFGIDDKQLKYEQNSLILKKAVKALKNVYPKADKETQSAISERLKYIFSEDGRKAAMTYLGTSCNLDSLNRA